MEKRGSAIWGGATIGLVVGLILGFFVGAYWTTLLYAVGIGAAIGVVANILGWLSDSARNRAATQPTGTDHMRSLLLQQAESVLSQSSPADFETTQNAASMCVAVVSNLEGMEAWRAGYDSLDSFYAAHEARHPDIRLYAAAWGEMPEVDPNDPPNGTGAEIVERMRHNGLVGRSRATRRDTTLRFAAFRCYRKQEGNRGRRPDRSLSKITEATADRDSAS